MYKKQLAHHTFEKCRLAAPYVSMYFLCGFSCNRLSWFDGHAWLWTLYCMAATTDLMKSMGILNELFHKRWVLEDLTAAVAVVGILISIFLDEARRCQQLATVRCQPARLERFLLQMDLRKTSA